VRLPKDQPQQPLGLGAFRQQPDGVSRLDLGVWQVTPQPQQFAQLAGE